jgi:hypothetical protein
LDMKNPLLRNSEAERHLNYFEQFVHKYGYMAVLCAAVLSVCLISSKVYLYGDDLVYYQFSSGGTNLFISSHIYNYMHNNGRAIVHILASIFLGWDMHIWELTIALMIGGLIFFGLFIIYGQNGHISSAENKPDHSWHKLYASMIFFAGIAFLDIAITRQSVYWLTGSFNYVYPMLMLFAYWAMLIRIDSKNKFNFLLPVLAFLSAATVEQASLMAFGLTVLDISYKKLIIKKKISRLHILALVFSTIGMISVISAPGVFFRTAHTVAPVEGFLPLFKHNIKIQGANFLFSREMAPYLLFSIITAIGIVYKCKSQSSIKSAWLRRFLFSACSIGLICWAWQFAFGKPITDISEGSNIDFSYKELILFLYIGACIFFLLFYSAVIVIKNDLIKNATIPLFALILGVGSQTMMIISPIYGPRNLLSLIIMLCLYTAALLPYLDILFVPFILAVILAIIYKQLWLILILIGFIIVKQCVLPASRQISIFTCYLCIILIGGLVMLKSYYGYAANAKVYENNLAIAADYVEKNQKGELIQNRLPYEMYAWNMPYETAYYIDFYKLFIGTKQDTKIIWN